MDKSPSVLFSKFPECWQHMCRRCLRHKGIYIHVAPPHRPPPFPAMPWRTRPTARWGTRTRTSASSSPGRAAPGKLVSGSNLLKVYPLPSHHRSLRVPGEIKTRHHWPVDTRPRRVLTTNTSLRVESVSLVFAGCTGRVIMSDPSQRLL